MTTFTSKQRAISAAQERADHANTSIVVKRISTPTLHKGYALERLDDYNDWADYIEHIAIPTALIADFRRRAHHA